MALETLAEGLKRIYAAIGRKKGGFCLTTEKQIPVLAVGSWRAVEVEGGFVVTLQLDHEKLLRLRQDCDELLKQTVS